MLVLFQLCCSAQDSSATMCSYVTKLVACSKTCQNKSIWCLTTNCMSDIFHIKNEGLKGCVLKYCSRFVLPERSVLVPFKGLPGSSLPSSTGLVQCTGCSELYTWTGCHVCTQDFLPSDCVNCSYNIENLLLNVDLDWDFWTVINLGFCIFPSSHYFSVCCVQLSKDLGFFCSLFFLNMLFNNSV